MPFLKSGQSGLIRNIWNPGMIPGLQLWLCAADTSSITIDTTNTLNANSLLQWGDKSPIARNFRQTLQFNQPILLPTGLNGLPTVNFNGSAFFLSTTVLSGLLNNVSSAAFYILFQKPNTSQAGNALGISNTNLINSAKLNLYLNGGNNPAAFGRRLDADTAVAVNSNGNFQANTPFILGAIANYATANMTLRCFGAQTNSATFQTAGNTTAGDPLSAYVGRNPANLPTFFSGRISSIICWHNPIQSDIEKVEWYLHYRYKLMASLNNSHPYKNTKP